MLSVETIPGMRGGRDEGKWWRGVNSSMIYCKNFYKCYNVAPTQYNNKK
jgi:hypothetical protein